MKPPPDPSRIIILAAGRGHRMGAASERRPKALLPIGMRSPLGETFLGRLLVQWGHCSRVAVVAGWRGGQIREFLASRHPGTACTTNRAFASTGSLRSLHCAVTSHPWLMAGMSHTIYCDADIILSDNLASRILTYRGPSAIVAGRNGGLRDAEQVGVFGTSRRPRFLGKALDRATTGTARWLGEAAGVVILAPADQPAALSAMALILKISPRAEHEDLTRELMAERRICCLLAKPAERFMECDTPEDLRQARGFLKEAGPTSRSTA